MVKLLKRAIKLHCAAVGLRPINRFAMGNINISGLKGRGKFLKLTSVGLSYLNIKRVEREECVYLPKLKMTPLAGLVEGVL